MDYTNEDLLFFSIILKSCRETYEKVITDSLSYKLYLTKDIIDLKKTKIKVIDKTNKISHKQIIPFGFYDEKKKIFSWYKCMKKDFYDHLIISGIKKTFDSLETIDKLFLDEVIIDKKNHNVIPYVMAVFNPNFNVIRFQALDAIIYAFVKLDIEDNMNFDNFIETVSIYNIAIGIRDKKYNSNHEVKSLI
jgi:hypothetical protein